ncbi:leucyl aminopeptidase [Moniliophthora roreri MCA 2997]|uniref:Aminopeptidase n=1 Tax=Moniliophthora roreri (strain MCA 2997) TaxID=1381753 RepID=V2XH02_MONRO|nr:leucyl aminopeptidase [Moniliophthora roreri MCA 2997]
MSTITTQPSAASQYRLPTNVKPSHYDLTIRTDLDKLTFDGFVKISLDVKEETDTIVLNSNGLQLGKAIIYSDALKKSEVEIEQSYDDKEKRATFKFPTKFPAGSKAELQINYSGELKDNMVGYYRSSWEHEGETKYYALTQFEPVDARRAFPCWDEPQIKSTYAITLISKVNTTSISNMPAISDKTFAAEDKEHAQLKKVFPTLDGQWRITRHETTPPMSSYIVAFANGEFTHLETSVKMPLSGKTLPLRIYATPDVIHQAQFALDVKAKVLPLYERVFDVEYPLPKLDTLVANDFDAGAMENWGLITGRTRSFLLDPKSADVKSKKLVVTVQSHEVAHMWFGNITTMAWWDYLYLNEGFATLMGEVIIPDKAYPEFRANSEFINYHLAAAMSLDAKLSSHPIEVSCPNADYIGQIFDSLSYSKAASVLRMLAAHVGTDKFLEGVSIYLKNHLYGNSVTRDLWDGISKATGVDIVALMDNWITKIGFPVLSVTETESGIKVRQDRFLETGIAEEKDNQTIWNVPLSILTVDATGKGVVNNLAVLDTREETYTLDTSKPFKLNAGTNGVYRVLYSEATMKKIADGIAQPNSPFTLEDRLGLISDSMALSKAALMKLSSALTLINALRGEKEYLAWSGISSGLSSIASVWWEHVEISDRFDAFRRSLFAPLVQQLGYDYPDSESPDISQLRTVAIENAVAAEEMSVVNELKDRFKHFMETGDDSRIPADLQKATYMAAVEYGGRAEYEATRKIFDKPTTPSARVSAIGALASTQDEALIKETFQITKSGTRDQDVVYFFRGFVGNKKARRMVPEFFKENYAEFYQRFSETYTLKYLVESSFSVLSTEKDLQDTIAFFEDKDTSKYSLSLGQSLDSIRARIAYIKHSTEDLEKWLKEAQSKL